MFDSYGNKAYVTFRIHNVDDSQKYQVVNVDIYSTYATSYLGTRLQRRIIDVYRASVTKGEPLITGLRQSLQGFLLWGTRRRHQYNAPDNFKVAFVFPDSGNCTIMVEKKAPFYKLMEQRLPKKSILTTISRVVYRATLEHDPLVLNGYLFKMINIPENVSYCLENRVPYWFYHDGRKVEVRLKATLIDDSNCAIEISDGIWGSISIKDLDVFVNYYYHGHTRSKKWAMLSPKKLWTMLMDNPPSTSQEQLMNEFLSQNRTQDIVEERAIQLMNSLEERYPDKIRLLSIYNDKKVSATKLLVSPKSYKAADRTIMLVRGNICDWVIVDASHKTKTQKVKVYVYISHEYLSNDDYIKSRGGLKFCEGQLRGPICIDNVHTNSSLGDQFAARALTVMNDKLAFKLVSTIKGYIPNELTSNNNFPRTKTSRIPMFNEITGEDKEWRPIL